MNKRHFCDVASVDSIKEHLWTSCIPNYIIYRDNNVENFCKCVKGTCNWKKKDDRFTLFQAFIKILSFSGLNMTY